MVTGDEAKEGKSWHCFEKNLSVTLRARECVAFPVWVAPFFSWLEISRSDRRCPFFDGWHNCGQGRQPVRAASAAWPWNFESEVADGSVRLEHSRVVCKAKSHVLRGPSLSCRRGDGSEPHAAARNGRN